jgi:hypothetical protein
MTKKNKIFLSTIGLTAHLVAGKKTDIKRGVSTEFEGTLRKFELDALRFKNSNFLNKGLIAADFSFESQLLLGVDPLNWSARLKALIERFNSHEISLRLPSEEDWCRSFFNWCLMSNMVVFPKGFVQTDGRKEQFFAMSPIFVKRGYQDLIECAQREKLEIIYVKPEHITINEITSKLFLQRFLVKLGYRLNFFADVQTLNARSLKRQRKLVNIFLNWKLISKISAFSRLKEEIQCAIVKLDK